MSRDIFVQDIPASAASAEDIPDGWTPQPLNYSRAAVVAAAKAAAAVVDDSNAPWVHVSDVGVDIELDLGDDEPFMGFAFHDRSADRAAGDHIIARVLTALESRAFDPEGSESGIFSLRRQP